MTDTTAPVAVPDPAPVTAARAVRAATKAIIIRDGHLLVTVNSGEFPTFYLCPGGGQEHGEDAHEALRRECREEIGCDVLVGDFAFLRDYIGADHEFAEHDGDHHQLEAYFFCELAPGAEPQLTSEADTWQTGVAWLPLADLADLADQPLWPKALARWLHSPEDTRPGYLGNVN
ncbi:NUDIX domain-containing protein [Nocardioides sp.]|uniref:NUDIX domain-containing protein n=1 Tax=Nocardioides sp. TaxID=35761 RepID=UPI002B95528D|nr:NUDIX domain-containing protein [Nocardioides sp.]HXH78085.1 NUDIX domain-containing protein [Nocardioides sp.]